MEAARLWVLAIIVAACFVAAACSSDDKSARADVAFEEAVAAEARGEWVAAFLGFREAVEIDPGRSDAMQRGTAAAVRVATEPAGDLPVDIEASLLRWLTDGGEIALLADLLDRSVVAIPEGWAVMGSSDGPRNEQPARPVYLSAFSIDRYEVTNAQYERFLRAVGGDAPAHWSDGRYPDAQDGSPVLGVSWEQADGYCRWAGKRLPTEAEWERACRGPNGFRYPWGDIWTEGLANMTTHPVQSGDEAWALLAAGDDEAYPTPVGSYLEGASGYGVMDMCGNAAEWVADFYDPVAYETLPSINPVGEEPPWNHVVRGSAWLVRQEGAGVIPDWARCGRRNASHVDADPRIGFRCAV